LTENDTKKEKCIDIIYFKIDCQINLYGSILFECCLEKVGIMDIDIQFKQILQYDTLKELLEIITKSGNVNEFTCKKNTHTVFFF